MQRGARNTSAIALGFVAYVGVGVLAYSLFYTYYDDNGVSSETAFKLNFTLTFLGHLAATLGSSAIVGRALGARVATVVVAVAIGVALLLLPSLAALAFVNDCLGVSFPWDGGCPS